MNKGPLTFDEQWPVMTETAKSVNRATHLLGELDRSRALKSPELPE
jgi:hypothetical protein